MKTIKILVPFFVIALLISFTSCEETQDEIKDTNELTQTADEDALVENVFDNAMAEVDENINEVYNNKKDAAIEGCATRTVTQVNDSTREIVIDFGETNCTGPKGNDRRGRILITVVGRYRKPGFNRTVTFDNFFFNDHQVGGTRTVTLERETETGYLVYTTSLEDGKVTTADGREITREAQHTRTIVAGYDTPLYRWDNEYKIEGSASGVNSKGHEYTSTITEPLDIMAGCHWIRAGVKEMVVDGNTIVIDYGDGTCDAKAIVTINDGEPIEIIMRR